MNKVMIGVSTAEMARRADFYDWLNNMRKPENSLVIFAHGQSPARNRNVIIEQALINNCSHVFFVDDDVILQEDTLERLLRHDKEVISGLYLMRNYPHKPIIFDHADNDGKCVHSVLGDRDGLIPIVAAGLGCLLVSTDVFKALEKPYIRLGELESDQWCDDIGFFNRLRKAKIKSYCDLTATVGHISSVVLWPKRQDGSWFTAYSAGSLHCVTTPQGEYNA